MNRFIARAGAVIALLTLGSTMALAKPPVKKAVECPVCHMALSAKKSKSNTVAVKLTPKGKTMYCCAKCKMPASVLVKPGKKGGKM